MTSRILQNIRPWMWLLLFAGVFFVVRLFWGSLLLRPDDAEQIILAQALSPGYPAQPPLYSWMQYLVFQFLGTNPVSLYLLRSVLIFGFLYYYYQIALLHCHNKVLACCALLSLALMPFISAEVFGRTTHSLLVLFTASMTWYWWIKPSTFKPLLEAVVLGILIGMGCLSKSNYLLFLVVLMAAAFSIKEYRDRWLPYLWVVILMALLVSSIYWHWLMEHTNIGFQGVSKLNFSAGRLSGLKHMIWGAIRGIVPFFLFAWLFFPINKQMNKPIDKAYSISQVLIRYHVLLPFVLVAIILIVGVGDFKERWLAPLVFLVPVLFFAQIAEDAFENMQKKIQGYLILCVLAEFINFCTFIDFGRFADSRSHFPVQMIVDKITKQPGKARVVVVDDNRLRGNLMLALKDKSVHVTLLGSILQHQHNSAEPFLVVWRNTEDPTYRLKSLQASYRCDEPQMIYSSINSELLGGYMYCEPRN